MKSHENKEGFAQFAMQIDFWTLLKLTQECVSQHYAAVLTGKSKPNRPKAYTGQVRGRKRKAERAA